jgi:vitamin B12 transporter
MSPGLDAAGGVSELVVTATRSPQPADQVGQSVTILGAAQIRASQAVVVSDLLSRTPGVAFSRNGGPGGVTALRIRGAESDQTVVVVDGVKLNDPAATGGGYNFANLMVGDIASIEVLRGAQSTLWGSQAIGGVVSIVTTRASAPFEGDILLEAGSQETTNASAALGGAGERGDWRLAASRYATQGVSSYRLGAEDDRYLNAQLSGQARIRINDEASLDLRALYAKARKDFDGFPAPAYAFADTAEYGRSEDLVAYAGLNFGRSDGRLKSRLAAGVTRTSNTSFDPAQGASPITFDADGRNRRLDYQGVWSSSPVWTATFGAETERSEMRTSSPFDPQPSRAEARIDSAYVQIHGAVARGLSLTAGLRRDRHDTFGGHTLGQVAAAWSLNEGDTVIRASFGQGFKAPSLYQLYSDYGNAALAAEEADAWDIGLQQQILGGKVVVTATYFDRDADNQIDFVSCATGSTDPLCRVNGGRFGYYDNTAKARARGVELIGSARIGALALDANYAWTEAENVSPGPNLGKALARRPEHLANLQAAYAWPTGLTTTAAVRYVGESFDSAANTYRLEGYAVVDLRASLAVSEQIELHARVENAFNEGYETVRNYGSAGRGVFVGLRARF